MSINEENVKSNRQRWSGWHCALSSLSVTAIPAG